MWGLAKLWYAFHALMYVAYVIVLLIVLPLSLVRKALKQTYRYCRWVVKFCYLVLMIHVLRIRQPAKRIETDLVLE
jgi:hypothetical protein